MAYGPFSLRPRFYVLWLRFIGTDEFNDPTLSLEEALADNYRIDYFYRHFQYIHRAIK